MSLKNDDWIKINEMVKAIYSTPSSAVISDTIVKMSYIISFSHSMYHSYKRSGNKTIALDYHSDDLPKEVIDAYSNDYENIDYIAWYSDIPISRAYRDSDIIDNSVRDNSELMNKWMLPNNMYYCLSSTVAYNRVAFAGLSFFNSKGEGDFSDDDKEKLSIITDHLSIRLHNDYLISTSSSFTDPKSDFLNKYHLSRKEAEILKLINEGNLRDKLAELTFISDNTLKKHLSNIYKKFNINSYEQLIQIIKGQDLE